MRTFLTILGALSLLVLAVLLSPIIGIGYVISAPAILLIVIIVAVIKAIVKPRKKGGSK
jgi:hypothetical protein